MQILQMALAFCKAMQHFFTPLSLGNMKVSKNLSEGGWTPQNPQVNWNLPFGNDALDCITPPLEERDPPHALGTTACPPVFWDSTKTLRATVTEGTTPGELHQVCLPMANGRITFLSPIFWNE